MLLVLVGSELIILILLHLLEFIGIGSSNKVALHVVYVAIGIHKILLILALDLNAAHDDVVLNVDTLLFLFSALAILWLLLLELL